MRACTARCEESARTWRRTGSVLSLLLAFHSLRRAVAAVMRDPETRALPLVAGALVLTGTIFYWRAEDWTVVQAL
jgi:hypothetical protein